MVGGSPVRASPRMYARTTNGSMGTSARRTSSFRPVRLSTKPRPASESGRPRSKPASRPCEPKGNGEGQPLTKLNAIALAGRWYNWFVKQHEADPGKPKYWRDFSDHVVWNVIRPEAPDEYEEDPGSDPHADWQYDPEVREAVRPQIAELARVATFLANEGKALNLTAHALFVDAVSDNLLPAIQLLEKRANGDYARDERPDTFPPFADGAPRSPSVSCWELFEAFVLATKPAPKTVTRWRAVFLEMQREWSLRPSSGRPSM